MLTLKSSSPLLFKMKFTNLNSRITERTKLVSENTKAIEQQINKRLLEKHKPKHLCKMQNMSDSKNKKECL